jgi:transcriptional regulator with XRE-family HTH domain
MRPRAWSAAWFAENFKELRAEDARLTQEEFAARAKVHRTYVSLVERGLRIPSPEITLRFAWALNVPVEKMFQPPRRCRQALLQRAADTRRELEQQYAPPAKEEPHEVG